jgi:hypothetical protein
MKTRSRVPSAVIGCLLGGIIGGALAHGDVVLHPGTITGTVGLTNWTPTSGGIAVSANVNGFSGSTSLSGNTFALTIESDQTYNNISVSQYPSMADGASGYFVLNRSNANLYVPLNGTASLDLVRAGGALALHVTAAGGTVVGYQAYASGNMGADESVSANVSSSSGADAALPMPAATVTVNGSASVAIVDADGTACTIAIPFPTQTITIAAGDSTPATEELSVTSGCSTGVFGTVGIDGVPGGAMPNDVFVYASGPQYQSADVYGNHKSYSFNGLSLATYNVRAIVMSFNPPFTGDSLNLPSANPNFVTLTADTPRVQRDFLFEGGTVSGGLVVSGTPRGLIHNASVAYIGSYDPTLPDGGPTSSGLLTAALSGLPNSHFSGVLTDGAWQPYQDFFFLQDQTAAIPLQDLLTIYRYSDPPITMSSGQSLVVPSRSLTLTEGQVIFDVIEAPGSPTIGISNPAVYASYIDPVTGYIIESSSYSYVTNAATPTVRVIGPPGVYTFQADAIVDGSDVQFASSTLTLGTPVDTPVGTNVVVAPAGPAGLPTPVTLKFATVTQAGQSTVSSTDVGPGAPPGYQLLEIIHDDHYVNISTSAGFTSKIEVCVQYDPTALGISASQESALTLQEFVCASSTSCAWRVVNGAFPGDNGGAAVSTGTHTICGVTTSLATFGLALPDIIHVPPTDSCIGTANEPASLTTDPGLCSVSVDNINQAAGGCSGGGGLMSCTFDGATSETLSLGAHDVAIEGTAIDGSTAGCTSHLSVVDREAPTVTCPAPVTTECKGATTHVVETARCADNCSCVASCGGASDFVLGRTTLACNAVDASGNSGSCSTVVTVLDTQAPAVSAAATPTVLWPPNHKLVPIAIKAVASDGCDATPTVTCAAASNEPDNGLGDGDTAGDIQWQNGALFLRAERSGSGQGRIYTVTCTALDHSGNQARASATVTVPPSQAVQ